jgi:hypothetical protein
MRASSAALLAVVLAGSASQFPRAGPSPADAAVFAADAPAFARDRILVKRRTGVGKRALADFHRLLGGSVLRTFRSASRLEVIALPAERTVDEVLEI